MNLPTISAGKSKSGFSLMPVFCFLIFTVAVGLLVGIFLTLRRILEVQESILDYIMPDQSDEDQEITGMSMG